MRQRSFGNAVFFSSLTLLAFVIAAFVIGALDGIRQRELLLNSAEAAVVTDSAEVDSAQYAVLVSKIVHEMPWLDSLENNRPKLCMKVVDHFELLEQNVDMNIRLLEASDTTVNADVSLYLASARFLRHHCYDVFSKQKMGDGVWFRSYERAARLMYTLETLSRSS